MRGSGITNGPGNKIGARKSIYHWPRPLIQASKQVGDAHNYEKASGGEDIYVIFPSRLLLKRECRHGCIPIIVFNQDTRR